MWNYIDILSRIAYGIPGENPGITLRWFLGKIPGGINGAVNGRILDEISGRIDSGLI